MYGYLGLCEAMLGYVGLYMAVYGHVGLMLGYVRLCYYIASFMHLENNTEHLILVCFKGQWGCTFLLFNDVFPII